MGITKAIGYIATLLVASAGVATPFLMAAEPEPETIIYQKPEEPEEPQPEEEPVIEEEPIPVAPAPPAPVETPRAEPAAPEPTTPVFHSAYDYIGYNAGLCPSEQVHDRIFWDQQRYLAFTRNNEHPWPGHIYYTDVYWHFYKLGWYADGDVGIASFYNMGLEDNTANWTYGLRMNYPTLTIYWGKMSEYDKFEATVIPPEWDQIANEANAYLHELDAAFNARCPGQ